MITVTHEMTVPESKLVVTFKLIELDVHYHGYPIVLKVPADTCDHLAECLEEQVTREIRRVLPTAGQAKEI